jgi:hypothetical protein
VIAIRRGSERLRGPIADVPLDVGDTLVLVVGSDFEKRNNLQRNFVIVTRHEVQKFTDPRKGLSPPPASSLAVVHCRRWAWWTS